MLLLPLLVGACGGTDGDTPPVTADETGAAVLYVSTPGDGGSDANTGTADGPFATLNAAIAAGSALIAGGETAVHVRVSGGTYSVNSDSGTDTHVVMSEGVSLYGGYDPADWSIRDLVNHETTITDSATANTLSTNDPHRAIEFPAGISTATVLDGFTVNGGAGDYGAAVFVAPGASPTVSNNKLNGGSGTSGNFGVAIGNLNNDALNTRPEFLGNTITAGTAGTFSYGVRISYGFPVLENNIITGASVGQTYAVAYQNGPSGGTIRGNTLNGGTGTTTYGLTMLNAAPLIDDNVIHGGSGSSSSIGILNTNGNPEIVNNTIIGGDGTAAGTSTGLDTYSTTTFGNPIIRNNVIDGGDGNNAKGLHINANSSGSFTPPYVQHNTISGGSAGTNVYAIVVKAGGHGVIENNILFTAGGTNRYCVWEQDAASDGGNLHNNTLFDCPKALYADYVGTGGNCALETSRNCYTAIADANDPAKTTQGGAGTTLGNVSDTPVFVSGTDLHLTTGTPTSISEGGLDLTADVPVDKDGTSRTAPVSMGAYEY